MEQDSTRFFKRYNRIVILSFVGLFIVSILLLFLLYNIETQKEKQMLFFELNERTDALNSLLKASLNHLEFMKTQAENFMANPQTPKPKTPSVYEAMKDYFEFEPRGKLPIKGIGEVEMFFLNRLKREFSFDELGFLPSQKFFNMYKELSEKK